MKIYLVCENVDLGYHVVKAFKEESAAINYAKYLDEQHRKNKSTDMLKYGWTKEAVENHMRWLKEEFFVVETELNEVTF